METINFLYFAHNYTTEQVLQMIKKGAHCPDHLISKFGLETGIGTNDFIKMFMNLDNENKIGCINWINENYKNL